MKKVFLVLIFLAAFVEPSHSEEMSKDILDLKNELDSYGYRTCSKSIVNAFDFVSKDSEWFISKRWYSNETDEKPAYIYYSIKGNDKRYGKTGLVTVQKGTDGQCWGSYSITEFVPNTTCSAYMSRNGFTKSNGWVIDARGKNGDGGEYIFLEVENTPALKFILNDTPNGCMKTKYESL